MMSKETHIITEDSKADLIRLIERLNIEKPVMITIDYEPEKIRTAKQNHSYWKWLTMLAEALNDAGFYYNDQKVIELDVAFTKNNLHESVCKVIMEALWPEKKSTTELTTVEMQELYKHVDYAVATKTGCRVDWPDRISQTWEMAS